MNQDNNIYMIDDERVSKSEMDALLNEPLSVVKIPNSRNRTSGITEIESQTHKFTIKKFPNHESIRAIKK